MVDDDMKMEALSDTGVLKAVVTMEDKMSLERKGQQSYQGYLNVRIMAFRNGALSSLYDKSDGFYRRQIVIMVKPKPEGRLDDRKLSDKLSDTNNHAFRMSLNSNVFISLGLPVTQRAYLLGHSVETNERSYSHMKTESLVDLRDVLNRASHTNDAQSQSIHTHTHTKIVNFGQIKNSERPINTRHFGI